MKLITAEDYEALITAAQHGLSLMLCKRAGETVYHLWHPCHACENAIRFLQSIGRMPLPVHLKTSDHPDDSEGGIP